MNSSLQRGLGFAALGSILAYAAYVATTWLRYGRVSKPKKGEADVFLDRFMPTYDVVERHRIAVDAPASVTLAAACSLDLEVSLIVRSLIEVRGFLMGARADGQGLPGGMLTKMQALGWRVLAELPEREIVMGAVTQPWKANVVFHGLSSEEFRLFRDPDFVKIAWTLRADPISPTTSVFHTETRVFACGPASRSKFRKYWAVLSPGIVLIRLAILAPLKREAERRARGSAPHGEKSLNE